MSAKLESLRPLTYSFITITGIRKGEVGQGCTDFPNVYEVKGKAFPLQARSGPESSRKLRFPDLMTTAQDGGKVVSLTHRPPLPPGNISGTHFC